MALVRIKTVEINSCPRRAGFLNTLPRAMPRYFIHECGGSTVLRPLGTAPPIPLLNIGIRILASHQQPASSRAVGNITDSFFSMAASCRSRKEFGKKGACRSRLICHRFPGHSPTCLRFFLLLLPSFFLFPTVNLSAYLSGAWWSIICHVVDRCSSCRKAREPFSSSRGRAIRNLSERYLLSELIVSLSGRRRFGKGISGLQVISGASRILMFSFETGSPY